MGGNQVIIVLVTHGKAIEVGHIVAIIVSRSMWVLKCEIHATYCPTCRRLYPWDRMVVSFKGDEEINKVIEYEEKTKGKKTMMQEGRFIFTFVVCANTPSSWGNYSWVHSKY